MIEDYFSFLTLLQIVGTVFGVTQVLLSRKNNVNNYLFGIAGILVSMVVLYESKLYSDILLQLYYLVMSIYGWYYWNFGKQRQVAPISYSNRDDYLKAVGIVIGTFVLMAVWLKFYTNSDVPLWDASSTAFAWAGMWLMAKRKMENWVFLNIANTIDIPLLIYKELYIYAGLTLFLFIVGVSGYLKWQKIVQNEQQKAYSTA